MMSGQKISLNHSRAVTIPILKWYNEQRDLVTYGRSMYRINGEIKPVGFQFVYSFIDVMILGERLELSRIGLDLYRINQDSYVFFHTGKDFVSRAIDCFWIFLDDKVQEFFPLSLPDRCRLLFLRRRHRAVSVTIPWWRHHLETISPSMTPCEGNPSVTGGFPSNGQWCLPWMYRWVVESFETPR